MERIPDVIQDLSKKPLPGDIFLLGENQYVTIVSVRSGQLQYVPGAHDLRMFRDAPEDVLRSAVTMPYKSFRKWLVSIAAGKRMDTPPPG